MTVRLMKKCLIKNNRSCFARTMGGYFCVLESCFLEIYNVIQKQFVVNCFFNTEIKKCSILFDNLQFYFLFICINFFHLRYCLDIVGNNLFQMI